MLIRENNLWKWEKNTITVNKLGLMEGKRTNPPYNNITHPKTTLICGEGVVFLMGFCSKIESRFERKGEGRTLASKAYMDMNNKEEVYEKNTIKIKCTSISISYDNDYVQGGGKS